MANEYSRRAWPAGVVPTERACQRSCDAAPQGPDSATRLAAALLGFVAFIILAGLVKAGALSAPAGVFVVAAAVALADVAWRPGGGRRMARGNQERH